MIASHREAVDQALSDQQPDPAIEFDTAELERQATQQNTDATVATSPNPTALETGRQIVESVAESTNLPEERQHSHVATHRPEGVRQYQPDPFPMEQITLGEDNEAPKMRLYRNNRLREMAIQFDSKPVGPEGEEGKYLDMLREAGFRWSQNDAVWTQRIDPEEKWRTHAAAEKVFREVGNAIRADQGLEPVAVQSV
ncbi:MAG: hypothetical protein K8U57_21495 [Planctomycetes bacterium]|nr:hypothetical protein [Planctomycetota bacterium]